VKVTSNIVQDSQMRIGQIHQPGMEQELQELHGYSIGQVKPIVTIGIVILSCLIIREAIEEKYSFTKCRVRESLLFAEGSSSCLGLNGLVEEEKSQLHNRKLLLVRTIGGKLELKN